MKHLLIIFLILFLFKIQAQVIPDERRINWSIAGYGEEMPDPDYIVNVKDFGAIGDGINNDYDAILSAIDFLSGEMGVVYFPAGEYLIESKMFLPDSIILRGESNTLTTLKFNLLKANSNCINVSKSQNLNFIKVINGFNKGSEKIVIENVSTFNIGDYAEIRQENGSWDVNPAEWAKYSIGQILRIIDIKGDTLFIDRPLRFDYETSLNISISKIIPKQNVGIEKLKIKRINCPETGGGSNIIFNYSFRCWVNDIESDKSVGGHINIYRSRQIQITHSYIHDSFYYDGKNTSGYGVTLSNHTCECLIEDNIFKHLRHAMIIKAGSNANVFGYNYSIEAYRSESIHDYTGDISSHGHYAFLNLFEGNIVQNIIIDHYWGPSGPYNTYFRNRAELYGIIMSNQEVFKTEKQNFVGNEVTGQGIFYMYILSGSDHFEYANNIKGTIEPSNTNSLTDFSYYLTEIPNFWNVQSQWPSIGIPNILNSGTIPAKERYESNYLKIYETNINADFNINIYPNPSSEGIFNIVVNSKKYFHGFLSVNNVILKLVFKKEIFLNKGNNYFQIDISRFSNGIYFVNFNINNKTYSRKIIKN